MGQTGMREGGMYSRTGFQERSQDVVAWTVKRNGPEKSRTICMKLWRQDHGDGVGRLTRHILGNHRDDDLRDCP